MAQATDETSTSTVHLRSSATGPGRVPGLDGLRALAVLLVLCFHFGVPGLAGGFVGVDAFYVLSGFLITGLLLGELHDRRRVALLGFWARRARRLLPALLVVLVAVSLVVRFVAPAGTYPGFRGDAFSALFYVSNWWQISSSSNYFVATGAISPLAHTWSLAVEEQFYLVWPLVVLAVFWCAGTMKRGIRLLLIVSVVGAAASAVAMAVRFRPGGDVTRLYFGTDTHAQSILVGAALACVLTMVQHRRGQIGMAARATGGFSRLVLSVAGVLGGLLLVVAALLLNGGASATYRGGFLLVSMATAALVVSVVMTPEGVPARMLSLPPMLWLGMISYGVYLWHFPVAVFLDGSRTGLTGPGLLVLRILATICLATASYYLIERPVMERHFWRSLRSAVPTLTLVTMTAAVVTVTTIGQVPGPALAAPGRVQSVRSGAQPVLMFGDSTALTLGMSLAGWTRHTGDGIDLIDESTIGCGVTIVDVYRSAMGTQQVSPACSARTSTGGQWPALERAAIVRFHPSTVILLSGRWEVHDVVDSGGTPTDILQQSYAADVRAGLEQFVAVAASAGARTVLMTAPYFSSGERTDGRPLAEDDPARVRAYNRIAVQVAAAHPGAVTLVPVGAAVSPGGRYAATVGRVLLRAPDGVHFPYDAPYFPNDHAPDTLAQVVQFEQWIAPRVMPAILASVHAGALPVSPADQSDGSSEATPRHPVNGATGMLRSKWIPIIRTTKQSSAPASR